MQKPMLLFADIRNCRTSQKNVDKKYISQKFIILRVNTETKYIGKFLIFFYILLAIHFVIA